LQNAHRSLALAAGHSLVPAFCVLYRLTRARRVAPARGRCRCAPALCCCTSAWANVTACWKWHEHRPSVVGAIGIPVCLTLPFCFFHVGTMVCGVGMWARSVCLPLHRQTHTHRQKCENTVTRANTDTHTHTDADTQMQEQTFFGTCFSHGDFQAS
jgi:hypothetical protein